MLPEAVASQIAAGEVIQRPANVVKELVENSIDAGATKIEVYIVDAGRTLIQVVDNGRGMSASDARLAFERHATSKIKETDDLYTLQTMGFRGEALPSIAAVSMVELRTRREGDEVGTAVSMTGARMESQKPAACPAGCNIKVLSLFFNVPARRKFLKSDTTEMNNITNALYRIVLVYPGLEFSLSSNGSEIMHLMPANTARRIADVFGKKLSQSLLPVNVETSLCKVSGYVGKPESARKKVPAQYFFANGRFMRHAYFAKAVTSAFERLVPAGEQIPYFIYLETDPASIDVNIHPAKTEIKFENESAVWQILSAAVREAVGVFSQMPTLDFENAGKRPEMPVYDPGKPVAPPRDSMKPGFNPFEMYGRETPRGDSGWEELYKGVPRREPGQTEIFAGEENPGETPPAPQGDVSFQYAGQYIITPAAGGVLVMDQYRAHVRVLYERYSARIASGLRAGQRLLFPEAVKFETRNKALLETVIAEMEKFGFELSPLGADNYAVNSVPGGLEGINPSVLVQDMVEDAMESGNSSVEEINRELALSMARKAAYPCGQVLTREEAAKLVRDLFACASPGRTPDGKKTFVMVSDTEIERLFT